MVTDIEHNTTTERKALFARIYREVYPRVAAYVARRGGSPEHARDVFHDAFITVYEKYGGEQSIENAAGYMYGTARHLWARRFRQAAGYMPLDDCGDICLQDEEPVPPSGEKLLGYLERFGKKCMELLKAAYYDRLDMAGLATRFGYSGSRSATVQKHKCLDKVRNTVKEKGLAYEDFT